METILYFTIYSNSTAFGNFQIESEFMALYEDAENRLNSELDLIFKRNNSIEAITYTVEACTKTYIRRKKPYSHILTPKLIFYPCPKSWLKYNNVTFRANKLTVKQMYI